MTMRVFVTHDTPGPQWQLGSPSPELGAFVLIGWDCNERDGGVPEKIVAVLAAALSAFGRVTFACSAVSAPDAPGWTLRNGDFVTRYRARSVMDRMAARLSAGASSDLALLSTVAGRSVAGLFDDAGYPWWNQSQFVLVSPADAAPPDFDQIGFDPATLLESGWLQRLPMLATLGVQAILRPGVDGDVAGLLCTSTEVRDRFEAILSRCAREGDVALQVVSADRFGDGLASSPAGD
jgi:hypothetical protein